MIVQKSLLQFLYQYNHLHGFIKNTTLFIDYSKVRANPSIKTKNHQKQLQVVLDI